MFSTFNADPCGTDCAAFPTRTPYIKTAAPGGRSATANLCFAGTSEVNENECCATEIGSPLWRSRNAISTLSFGCSLRAVRGMDDPHRVLYPIPCKCAPWARLADERIQLVYNNTETHEEVRRTVSATRRRPENSNRRWHLKSKRRKTA